MEKTAEKRTHFILSRVVKTERGYGLFISCEGEGNRVFADITQDPDKLCEFSDMINTSEVSFLHIEELIEDFLE